MLEESRDFVQRLDRFNPETLSGTALTTMEAEDRPRLEGARRRSNGAPAHRHDVAAYADVPRSTRNVAVAERQPCLVARSRCCPGRRSRTTRVARPERSVRARRRPSRTTASPRQAAAREPTRIWTRRLTPARRRRGRTDSRIAGRGPDPARVARHGVGLVAESLVPSS